VQAALRSSTSRSTALFAGVGVDYSNQRRNKLAGKLIQAEWIGDPANSNLGLYLETNENLGNCPKYITIRQLEPFSRVNSKSVTVRPTTTSSSSSSSRLNQDALEILRQASTAYIATIHIDTTATWENDMGFNHRGGPRGFIRYFEDGNGAHLVLPDYSGNRFYQSLGNIESDGKISVYIADFVHGDSLHISGTGVNLYHKEAEILMPRVKLLTLVSIEEAIVIKGSINLRLMSEEVLSPYNPPIYFLVSESGEIIESTPITAALTNIEERSNLIKSFTWKLSRPLRVNPGGYAIFDFSTIFKKKYQHMNNKNPQLVNDDFVRTWTVSRQISPDELQITVKKSGFISSFLHSLVISSSSKDSDYGIQVEVKGGGGLLLNPTLPVPTKMLWVCGGIGITPFMSVYDYIKNDLGSIAYDIILFFSAHHDEIDLLKDIHTKIKVVIFQTSTATPTLAESLPVTAKRLHSRRLQKSDFQEFDYQDRECFLCGPDAFMKSVKDWLSPHTSKIHTESFF
jgi:ferredoxin-NADP reductase